MSLALLVRKQSSETQTIFLFITRYKLFRPIVYRL